MPLFARVYVLDEVVLFPKPEESTYSRFMSVNQVEMPLREEDQMLVIFSSLRAEGEAIFVDIPMVCEFLDVFPNDISDFQLEREVEFIIDSVPGIRPVSMTPYKMSASKLVELKK